MVIIDQDGSGPGGSNQMAMMVLLQSPQADVLGITMVSGNAWEPKRCNTRCACSNSSIEPMCRWCPEPIFPLVRTEEESKIQQQLYGTFSWYGAWGDSPSGNTSRQPYHGPVRDMPKLAEGNPAPSRRRRCGPLSHSPGPCASASGHDLRRRPANQHRTRHLDRSTLRRAHAGHRHHGRQPQPADGDPEFANNPRHEFNFWFDPEAAHITLRAHWPRIDLTTVDISIKTGFTKAMLEDIATRLIPPRVSRRLHQRVLLPVG